MKSQSNTKVTVINQEYVTEHKKVLQAHQDRRSVEIRKKTISGILLALVLAIVVVMAKNILGNVHTILKLDQDKVLAQQKQEETKEQNQVLKEQVDLLQNDDYITKLARSQYYLSKDGEIIFSLPDLSNNKLQ